MFEGQFKSRSVVSLRGATRAPQSREEILRRAEQDRRAREAARIKNEAASRITRWARCRLAYLLLVRLARERLDNLLLSQGDGVDLERLITYSVLSLRMPRDARTLDRVVSLLLAPEAVDIIAKAEGGESIPSRLVAADVLKPSFLSLLSAMDTNAAFRRQLPRFFLLLVQSNSLSSLIVADGLLSLLASTEAFSSAVRRLALPLFVAEKAAGGSAKAATESVMPVAPPKPVLPFSLSNALQCDVVADTLRIVMDASNIRQLVGGFLPREGAGKILSSPRAPLRALCEYLSSSQAAGGIPADEVLQLCMAGNLAHGFANQSLADDVSYKAYLEALVCLLPQQPMDKDRSPEWVQPHISALRSNAHLRKLRQVSLSSSDNLTFQFGALIGRLCMVWRQEQFDMLTAAVFDESQTPAAVGRIWPLLVATPASRDMVDRHQLPLSTNGMYWDALYFFALGYHHASLSLTDDEFLRMSPHPRDIVTPLLSIVQVIFRLSKRMRTSTSEAQSRTSALRSALVRLLVHLYDRDARRSFLESTTWTVMSSAFKRLLGRRSFIDLLEKALRSSHAQDEGEPSSESDNDSEEDEEVDVDMTASKRARASRPDALGEEESAVVEMVLEAPFLMPFEERVYLFRNFVNLDASRHFLLPFVTVQRDRVFDDLFEAFSNAQADFSNGFKVNFVNQFGLTEAGIDGGGLFKECITQLFLQAFAPERQLFLSTSDGQFYPVAHPSPRQLRQFTFIGKMLALALRNNILLEAPFALFVLARLLGRRNQLDDLASFDPDLHRHLLFLKSYDDVASLSLTFSAVDSTPDHTKINFDLLPNGSNVPVVQSNRLMYIYLLMRHRLDGQISAAVAAMREGLRETIDTRLMRLFSARELQTVISGADDDFSLSGPPSGKRSREQRGFDVEDLRGHCVLAHGYSEDHTTIKLLFEVLSEFSASEKGKFLRFVTSCSRPPLLGFKELHPAMAIHKSEAGRLPSASTCVNLLKLPPYETKDELRTALLYAIENSGGFELS